MKVFLLAFLLAISHAVFSQGDDMFLSRASPFSLANYDFTDPFNPYVTYYHFYDSVQMIVVDLEKIFVDDLHWRDMLYVKSSMPDSWYIMKGHEYIYPAIIFRHVDGTILRSYNATGMQEVIHGKPILLDSIFESKDFASTAQLKGKTVAHYCHDSRPPFYVVRSAKTQKSGLIDSLGNIALAPVFDEVHLNLPTTFVKFEGKWGMLNERLEVLAKPVYDALNYLHHQVTDEYLIMWKDKECGIMHRTGKVIIPPTYTNITPYPKCYVIELKGQFGFMDSSFQVTNAPKYTGIEQFYSGFYMRDKSQLVGVLDSFGNELIAPQYKAIQAWNHKFFKVTSTNDLQGIVNRNGKILVPIIYRAFQESTFGKAKAWTAEGPIIQVPFADTLRYHNGMHVVSHTEDDKLAVLNKDKEQITPYLYLQTQEVNLPGYVAVCAQKWGVVNQMGKEVIPCEYRQITQLKGKFLVWRDSTMGWFDINKQALTTFELQGEVAQTLDNGNITIRKRGMYGMVSAEGKLLLPQEYTYLVSAGSKTLLLIGQDKKFGYADMDGNIVIPIIYSSARGAEFGWIAQELNGRWGCLDITGKLVVPFEYDFVPTANHHRVIVLKKGNKKIEVDLEEMKVREW